MHTCTYSTAQATPTPSGEQRKSICMQRICTMHTCTIETFLSIFHLDRFQCHNLDWNRYLFKNSTRYMYPIRASESTCIVASDYPIRVIWGNEDISRGTFGVEHTINLRWLILMDS